MTKSTGKKLLLTVAAVFVLGAITLGIHIYWATRYAATLPHINARTRYMARIDLHQPIDQTDAEKIRTWLLQQKGVDRVLVSPKWATAVFTYAPLTTTANGVVQAFKASLPYSNAVRYLPTIKQMNSACPVMH
jgi:hypothetical protein